MLCYLGHLLFGEESWPSVPHEVVCVRGMSWLALTLLACWSRLRPFWVLRIGPPRRVILRVAEVSDLELLILNKLWAAERLVCEQAVPGSLRGGSPISVSGCSRGSQH